MHYRSLKPEFFNIFYVSGCSSLSLFQIQIYAQIIMIWKYNKIVANKLLSNNYNNNY